jgi:beta-lactamase regulating signal transducer with metallopeptidase domain
MTSLDLLLSLARITVVGLLAILAGYWLLRRRPEMVPGLSLAGLLSGCVLLAVAGGDWPTLWKSSISAAPSDVTADFENANSLSATNASNNLGVSLSDLGGFLQALDVADSGSSFRTGRNLTAVLGILVALAFVRILIGLITTIRFHKRSNVVTSNRLQRLLAEFDEFDGQFHCVNELEFHVSEIIDAPCVTAINQRCIYLPPNWDDFSDDELTASIVHELGHLNRSDARWRLLAQLTTAFQVFHPLSHGLLRQLVLGQELSADRWAAEAIGRTRFVRGISQLALRLDNTALPRRSQGIGISHSSSFLIRMIKMLRNGMPAFNGKTHWIAGRTATLAVLAVSIVAASWSLSAEEPVRVASRIKPETSAANTAAPTRLWEVLPGRNGYWTLNVHAAFKHQVLGQWLNQADALFLNPGWKMVAAEHSRDRRAELGLSLTNIAGISGTVAMETKFINNAENNHKFHSSVTANEFVMQMQQGVDWANIAAALPEERLDAGIRGLIGPSFPAETAEKMIETDVFAKFFAQQTDPHRFVVKQDAPDGQPETSPILTSLWKDHSGQIATMVVLLPSVSGPGDSQLQKLMRTLHETGEYYVVGIDPSADPQKVKLRLGMTPRRGTTAIQLAETMSQIIQLSIELSKEEKTATGETPDATEAEILRFLSEAKPEVRKSSNPELPSTVLVEGDLAPNALWLAIGG